MEARPRYRRNLLSRYEATTLAPRAKQAPRRTPVRWYPTHGSQHDQPSLLQAPSLLVARVPTMTPHDPTAKDGPNGTAVTPSVRARAPESRRREGTWAPGPRNRPPQRVHNRRSPRGALSRYPPTEPHRAAYDHPGVYGIGADIQRRNGTPGPGVTGILDSGSHINGPADPRASRPPGPAGC